MVSNRGRDNRLEMALRSALHRRGNRFRKHWRIPGERGTIDIAFPKERLAVFVDGCFWHQCPDHLSTPRRNGDLWAEKLRGTKLRDQRMNAAAEGDGWRVLRLWEHVPISMMVAEVESALASQRGTNPDDRIDDREPQAGGGT
jgi:DNA mismatch endonuclease (patch repair protein)